MLEQGSRIRALRKRLDFSQGQFAEIFSSDRHDSDFVTQETVSKWERGITRMRSPEKKIESLLDFLEDPSEWKRRVGLSDSALAIDLFPFFDPYAPEIACPPGAKFPSQLTGRRKSLELLVNEAINPTCEDDEWNTLLERTSRGYSLTPLKEIKHIETIQTGRFKSKEHMLEVFQDNASHGIGPMTAFWYLSMGVVRLEFMENNEDPYDLIEEKGLYQVRKGVLEEIRRDGLFDQETPEDWVEKCPPRELLSFLKGFCLGLKSNPDKKDDVAGLTSLISQMESKLEAVTFIRNSFRETERLIEFFVSEFRKSESVEVTKDLRKRMKSVFEDSGKATQLMDAILKEKPQ